MPQYATFDRFEITMPEDQAQAASHPGDCTADVEALTADPKIAAQLDLIPPADLAAELAEYGAWSEEDLSDQTANRQRITWLAACQIREEAQQ